MDKEFHYYVNYIIAYGAGFNKDEAFKIAYSAQYVDDNDRVYYLDNGYANAISQTLDLTLNEQDFSRILQTFHFIPGDIERACKRRDGCLSTDATTANSFRAKYALRNALKSQNPYLVGVASHAYSDTWAHQNFTGRCSPFNAIVGFPRKLIPNIGHADAYHWPDKVGVKWNDWRINNPIIDNNDRFLTAASFLYDEYRLALKGKANLDKICMMKNLRLIFGKSVYANRYRIINFASMARIRKYQKYIEQNCHFKLPRYSKKVWLNKAIKFNLKNFSVKDEDADWFKFQEAIKEFSSFFPLNNKESNIAYSKASN